MAFNWVVALLVTFGSYVLVDGHVITIATPVVFTNNNGGGADEVQAPSQGTASMLFYAGDVVNAAWYTALDNIADLSAIRYIDVQPKGKLVQLMVGGYDRNGRVRIKIFADIG